MKAGKRILKRMREGDKTYMQFNNTDKIEWFKITKSDNGIALSICGNDKKWSNINLSYGQMRTLEKAFHFMLVEHPID